MELELISPEVVYYRGPIDRVTLPGVLGRFTVLPRHAAIISVLAEGHVTYSLGQKTEQLYIGAGLAEVRDDKVTVCVERLAEEYELYYEDEEHVEHGTSGEPEKGRGK